MTSIAVVGGLGWAGRRHVDAFIACGASVNHVVDTDPMASEMAKRIDARWASTLDDVDLTGFDLVVVALPVGDQPAVVSGLLDRGLRVLCEKPLGVELHRLAALDAHTNRDRLMVAYLLRFHPAFAVVAKWAAQRELVSVSVRSVTLKEGMAGWRMDPSHGGVIAVNGSHALDVAAAAAGSSPRLREVVTHRLLQDSEEPSYAQILGDYDSGATLMVETMWAPFRSPSTINGEWDFRVDVVSTTGSVRWHNHSVEQADEKGIAEKIDYPPVDLFKMQAQAALEWVQGIISPPIDYRSSRETTALIDHALTLARLA